MSSLAEEALAAARAAQTQSQETLDEINSLQDEARQNLQGVTRLLRFSGWALAFTLALILWLAYRHTTIECDREHVAPNTEKEARDAE